MTARLIAARLKQILLESPIFHYYTKYLCMSYLSQLVRILPRGVQTSEVKKLILSSQEALSKNKVLFAANDIWIKQVEQFLAEVSA
jgi:hypothetical protein